MSESVSQSMSIYIVENHALVPPSKDHVIDNIRNIYDTYGLIIKPQLQVVIKTSADIHIVYVCDIVAIWL